MADRTIVMNQGQIAEEGSAEKIATNPDHPYTRALLAAMPQADPVARAERRRQRLALGGPLGMATGGGSGGRVKAVPPLGRAPVFRRTGSGSVLPA